MAASTTIPRPPGDLGLHAQPHLPGVQTSPLISTGRDRETQLLARIRELENEVRLVRSENDKQVNPFPFPHYFRGCSYHLS